MRNNIYKLIMAASIVLVSCGDEQQLYPNVSVADEGSVRLRFLHAASDTVGVNLFMNDLKISAGAQSILSTGTVNVGRINFGGDFPVTGYASIEPASGNLSVVFPETYAIVSSAPVTYLKKTMSTANASLAAGSWNTVAFLGVSPTYETVVFSDDLTAAPIDGKAYVRFAGFIHNLADELTLRGTPPVTPTDPAPTPVILFQDVSYKEMTGFIALPRTGIYTSVQIVNETTGLVVATASAALSTFASNKAYTLFAQGRVGGPGTTAPGIGRMANR